MTDDLFSQLARLAQPLCDDVQRHVRQARSDSPWSVSWRWYRRATAATDPREFALAIAQSVACLHFGALEAAPHELPLPAMEWWWRQADPAVRRVLELGPWSLAAPAGEGPPGLIAGAHRVREFLTAARIESLRQACRRRGSHDAAISFLEHFLRVGDASLRRRHGVFYTPHDVVTFMVRSVDDLLRTEFHVEDGLAERCRWAEDRSRDTQADRLGHDAPGIRILDPAMGTGVFLVEIVRHVHRTFLQQTCRSDHPIAADALRDRWSRYVDHVLLPRLFGQERMLPALVLAQLAMVKVLARSGYDFRSAGRLNLFLTNTLQQPAIVPEPLMPASQSVTGPFSLVIGNPPFSGVSDNRAPWLDALLRGTAPDGRAVADYFLVDGQPLGERKHWLQDDYVKFIRLAHWQIETAGFGIVALVTNHGFLDNITFRGMRQQLAATFPRMTLVDLHGNQRGGERAPDGSHDESVFGIEQGVTLSFLRRPRATGLEAEVRYCELWGRRSIKLGSLQGQTASTLPGVRVEPVSPAYLLVPRHDDTRTHYEQGIRLVDLMPVHSTAAVTARDSLVVAFSEQELRERIGSLADPSVSDETIRSRYFRSARSAKYPPGDTRGWRLSEARQRLRDEPGWDRFFRDCLYRPFDRRTIFWAPWMVDWPRTAVMRHLARGANLALIARRQTPPSQACQYFWIADSIVVDGLIRSDNRGSESVFPLFVDSSVPSEVTDRCHEYAGSRHPNFAPEFLADCRDRFGSAAGCSESERGGDAEMAELLLRYMYALFHAPSYRRRFAAQLRADFPRVFLPRSPRLFHSMARAGETLIGAHLHWHRAVPRASAGAEVREEGDGPTHVAAGFPRYSAQRVWWNSQLCVGPVEADVWMFRVGTYQVCRKWLSDRRGRHLSRTAVRDYCRMVTAIRVTLGCMSQIDQLIEDHGGWMDAFVNDRARA